MAVRPPTVTTIRNGADCWMVDLLAAAECKVRALTEEVRHLAVVSGSVIVANPRKAIRREATRLDASLVLVVRKQIGPFTHRWSASIAAHGVPRHVRFRSAPRTIRMLCRQRGANEPSRTECAPGMTEYEFTVGPSVLDVLAQRTPPTTEISFRRETS